MGRFPWGNRPSPGPGKGNPMNPIAYGILLTLTVLAVVVLILAIERLWLRITRRPMAPDRYPQRATDAAKT